MEMQINKEYAETLRLRATLLLARPLGHEAALTALPKAGVQQAYNEILSQRKERPCSKKMDMEPGVMCVAKTAGWIAPGHCGTPHQTLSSQEQKTGTKANSNKLH